jgi:mRNA interferase RelE/StbE
LSNKYKIAETESFQKLLLKNKSLAGVYRRIVDVVYPMLRREPHFGPNIKRLKGDFSEFYRYRVGDYRLFYTIEEDEVVVVVVDLRTRQEAYRP